MFCYDKRRTLFIIFKYSFDFFINFLFKKNILDNECKTFEAKVVFSCLISLY